jgi:hypothetical protein
MGAPRLDFETWVHSFVPRTFSPRQATSHVESTVAYTFTQFCESPQRALEHALEPATQLRSTLKAASNRGLFYFARCGAPLQLFWEHDLDL